MLVVVDGGPVGYDGEFAAVGGESGGVAADDETFVGPAEGDEIGHRGHLEAVLGAEFRQPRQPGHVSVVVHDFADAARRLQTGQPGQIHRRLGVPGAAQHPAGTGDQREDMPRRMEVRRGLRRIGEGLDGRGAVEGGDARRRMLAGIDADREARAKRIGIARHLMEAEFLGALQTERRADQPAAMSSHEIDGFGRNLLRRHHKVALVLAVLIIGEDDHFAGGQGLY